jgi:hypothetical protein
MNGRPRRDDHLMKYAIKNHVIIICFYREFNLAKVDVAGSSPVSRSRNIKPDAHLRVGLLSFWVQLIDDGPVIDF